MSVGTILTTKTDMTGESSSPVKPATAATYKDIVEAIEACNTSGDKKRYLIRWTEVRNYLISKNSAYELYTEKQLKNRYKYLKKAKRVLK